LVFNPKLSWEFRTPEEIESRTVRAVRNHIKHAREVSPFYKQKLDMVIAEDIEHLSDLAELPLTTKEELIERNHEFVAVEPEHIVETVITSGSTGKPLIYPLTANDIERLAFNEALSFYGLGVQPGDRAQILVSLDRLFIAGMAYYRGLTMLGANTARVGVVPLEMQRHYLQLLRPTVIVGVPSFLLKLGADLQSAQLDTRTMGVSKIVCIGENIRAQDMSLNGVGTQLEELYNAAVFSTYGATELAVAWCECTEQCGGHSHPELVHTEIVDEQGRPVKDGTPGELVATPLGVEGMPLVRYRTGDITFKVAGSCPCGRNSSRIGPILGRTSQLIKLKGTTIYPATVTSALDELKGVVDYVLLLEGVDSLSDRVSLHVVASPEMVPLIAEHLRSKARVSVPVLISNQRTVDALRGDSRKKVRVVDQRKR
jgi:phenylacetate-CoA ligase